MYLWRIELDLYSPRIQRAMADRQKLHQLVTGLFNASRQNAKLLYRFKAVGLKVMLYIYSSMPLRQELSKDMHLTGGRDVTDWLDRMQTGQVMGFDFLTMPFKKVYDGEHKNSRRRLLHQPEERLAWLLRKTEQNGFSVLSVREDPSERIIGSHPNERGGNLYLDTWRYTGILQITDVELFRAAVQNGIGPEKAYGLGMLLLA